MPRTDFACSTCSHAHARRRAWRRAAAAPLSCLRPTASGVQSRIRSELATFSGSPRSWEGPSDATPCSRRAAARSVAREPLGTFRSSNRSKMDPQGPADQQIHQVAYNCGSCGAVTYLKASDPIKCRQCGYRILYKQRTKRMIQHEAR